MTAAATHSKKSSARLWWIVHQWVGLKLSILMSFVFFTGTLAVFANEIDWLINADMRVKPATVEREINWPAMADAVAAYAPGAEIAALRAPIDKGFTAIAIIVRPPGERRKVYLHPTTGEVRGDSGIKTFQQMLRGMHRSLLLPTKIGIPIVSSLSLLLAISLATSFVVYKKWWRGFIKPVRLRNARTFFGDFHRLAGLWSLWFTLLMILTGFWYLVESLGGDAPYLPRIWRAGIETTAEKSAVALPPILEAVEEAYPGLHIRVIVFANESSGVYTFEGQDKAILVRPSANAAMVSAETGKVDLVVDGRNLSIHQRISQMADPLHFGDFGGVWTKIIWFLFGVLLTFLSVSGVAIYSLRLLKTERAEPTARKLTRAIMRGIGIYAWPTLALVVLSFILLIRAFV